MPQTKKAKATAKKTKKTVAEKQKRPIKKSAHAQPIKEKIYINVKEFEPELISKTKKLKIIIGIFSVILFIAWLVLLRYNINSQSGEMNFSLLKNEINKSLIKFDNEVIDRKANEEIIINDIDQLKDKLKAQDTKPNSSLWPTRQFSDLGLTLQYPEDWQRKESAKLILEETNKEAVISIEIIGNKNNWELEEWLKQTKIDLSEYKTVSEIFKFSTATPQTLTYTKSTTTENEEMLYLVKQEEIILYIETLFIKEKADYKVLIEEIIKTIKTN